MEQLDNSTPLRISSRQGRLLFILPRRLRRMLHTRVYVYVCVSLRTRFVVARGSHKQPRREKLALSRETEALPLMTPTTTCRGSALTSPPFIYRRSRWRSRRKQEETKEEMVEERRSNKLVPGRRHLRGRGHLLGPENEKYTLLSERSYTHLWQPARESWYYKRYHEVSAIITSMVLENCYTCAPLTKIKIRVISINLDV